MKLLLAEDHNIVRNGIRKLLEDDKAITIAAEAINGFQVLDHISNNVSVDLVLTDVNMPEIDGISLISQIRDADPQIKVVILSMHDHKKYVMQAFQAGAHGYLLKTVDPEELLFALKHIHSGGRYLCAALAMEMVDGELAIENTALPAADLPVELTSREIEVLELIAMGKTNHEMSEQLFLSKRTIEGHRQSLTEKTGSRNTAALIRYAMLHRIIQ